MKKRAKLPTILGILILVSSLIAGVYLINSRQVFKLGAQVESSPKDVRIGNITNNSVTVTWTTDVESKGFVKWNKTNANLSKVALEESSTQSNVHMVNILGIDEGSDVFFVINSNGNDFKNNSLPWKTNASKQAVTSNNSLYATGIILAQDGTTAASAIVHLLINGVTLSTITSPEGSWVIPISTYIESVPETTAIEISVNAGPKGVSQAVIYPTAIKTTPVILLGKTYDFRTITNGNEGSIPESKLSVPESVEASSRFEIDKSGGQPAQTSVTLESVDEGEIITTTDPEFFGKGPSKTNIEVSVESELQTVTVATDKNGAWSWSPPNNLEPGEHTVTLKWSDANGVIRTLTRKFIVSASEGPAFVATPSATTVASSTPSASTTPRATSTSIATAPPTPETGSLTGTLGLFIMGIGILLSSIYVWNKEYAE
ncbi:MAG TPA: Ig-like domain-containing protein [Patescibacteria group bacterium]|nr:Ig-like domain-containing protein [Patescibacteria group bacterium]